MVFPVITAGLVLALALLVFVVFASASFFVYIVSISIWKLIGATLIILAVLAYTGLAKFRLSEKIILILVSIGVILLMFPVLFPSANMPLATLL